MGIPVISDVMDTIYDAHRKYADPRTKDWFMLWSNPIPIWILTISYLVFSIWLGPWYMKDRKPYNLRTFMVVYNLGLVVLSMYLVVEMLLSTSEAGYNWMCSPYNENTWKNPKELRHGLVLG
ncbi:ELOV1-like protein [Mya arenaria]|uniref:Elongation of very long chain fatty acids protein n=1 Tax=Mya arenaria TaxID=6604 RepID=A0ABY7FS40_MYAAR|nr:ELOV1-like protein [Mya arenaria]